MRGIKTIGLAGLFSVVSICGSAIAAGTPTGVWIDHTGRGAVEIKQCGRSLCGYIVWTKDSANNSICGRKIIGGVRPVGRGRWDRGWIYDPDRRSRFDVELKPLRSGKLRVMGYAGVKFLSETMIWKPAPADLKRCDKVAAKTPAPATPTNQTTQEADTNKPAAATTAPQPTKGNKIPVEQGNALPSKAPTQSNAPASQQAGDKKIENKTADNNKTGATQKKDGKIATLSKPQQGPTGKTQAPTTSKPDSRDDDDNGSGPQVRMKTCRVNLPYLTLQFPCPKDSPL